MNDIAVFTVCRNENRLMPLWVDYYASIFGLNNIFVYDDDSNDGCFDNIKLKNYEKINFNRSASIERFGAHDYQTQWNFIVEKYHELLKSYKWVIHADADDFIVANPDKYRDLRDFIDKNKKPYFRCKAYEIIHNRIEEEPIKWGIPILKQRKYWIRVTNLDKTSITSVSLAVNGMWVLGNHYAYINENEVPDNDLILVHLHKVDYDNYKKKYLIIDENITDQKSFDKIYGGIPLYWNQNDLDKTFDNITVNEQWGAKPAQLEIIPYKEIF